MAIMSAEQRDTGCTELTRTIPSTEVTTISKADYRAVYNAIDQYFSDHQAEINAAIPQPGRGGLSTAEKARIGVNVLEHRYIHGVN